jgi:hypothetical protein
MDDISGDQKMLAYLLGMSGGAIGGKDSFGDILGGGVMGQIATINQANLLKELLNGSGGNNNASKLTLETKPTGTNTDSSKIKMGSPTSPGSGVSANQPQTQQPQVQQDNALQNFNPLSYLSNFLGA